MLPSKMIGPKEGLLLIFATDGDRTAAATGRQPNRMDGHAPQLVTDGADDSAGGAYLEIVLLGFETTRAIVP